jgi:hypothetical protein
MFFAILSLLTGYQVYTFYGQVANRSTIENIHSEDYAFPKVPLFMVQILSYTILMYFSYINSNKAGNQTGLSEVSTNHSLVRDPQRAVQSIPADTDNGVDLLHPVPVREVMVKFKDDEIDPKMKVLDSEALKRSSINSDSVLIDIAATYKHLATNTHETGSADNTDELEGSQNAVGYPHDTWQSTSDTSCDQITPEQLEVLLKCLAEQEAAEKAGRLDEYLAHMESKQYVAYTRETIQHATDYLTQQILAMKQEEERNKHYNRQLSSHQFVAPTDDVDSHSDNLTQSTTSQDIITRVKARDYLARNTN